MCACIIFVCLEIITVGQCHGANGEISSGGLDGLLSAEGGMSQIGND